MGRRIFWNNIHQVRSFIRYGHGQNIEKSNKLKVVGSNNTKETNHDKPKIWLMPERVELLFWSSRGLLTCHTGDIINIEGFPWYQVFWCYIRNRLPYRVISIIIWSIVDLGTSRGFHVVKFKGALNVVCRQRWYLKNKYQYSSEIFNKSISFFTLQNENTFFNSQ